MRQSGSAAFGGGAVIGALGGLIGLGGAEFRLPMLIGVFRFVALEAVILNKAMSLVVVAAALVFRTKVIPLTLVAEHWAIVVNLLAGSLIGAWIGASWGRRDFAPKRSTRSLPSCSSPLPQDLSSATTAPGWATRY
nr:TSUP family transporter [Burkholderia stagnalis]